MAFDLATELELVLRLVVAAVLGAVIGIEREIHDHPAGIRTHLLVALGSALFTVLSIVGFPSADGSATDPSRVAAQIVTGIGFLGAGAILKYGPTVRGLTTAASLWAAAGIGMAAGAGLPFLGLAATIIVVLSLWPLRLLSERVAHAAPRRLHVRVQIRDSARLSELFDWLAGRHVDIIHLDSERDDDGGGRTLELTLGLPQGLDRDRLTAELGELDWVTLGEIGHRPE
jgi:putative Mg2+ transporter-C (MgtC) family protein